MRPRTRARLLPLAVALALVVAAGCGSDEPSSSGNAAPQGFTPPEVPMLQSLGAGEGKVNLVAWAGYVEDGSTDKSVDWVTPFEKETGCQVNAKVGRHLRRDGPADEVGPVRRRVGLGRRLVAADRRRRRRPGQHRPGAELRRRVRRAEDEAVELGQRRGLRHPPRPRGQPAHVAHRRGQAGPRLLGRGVRPQLALQGQGHRLRLAHLHRRRRALPHVDQARARHHEPLRAGRQAVPGLGRPAQAAGTASSASTGATTPRRSQAIKSGATVLGTSWQNIVNLAEADKAPVDSILPKEGSTGWSDTWMVSSKAANPNCAYLWMNHIISPKANAQVAEWFGEAPANRKSCQETSDKQFCATYHADDESYFDKVAYWTTPIKQCGDDRGRGLQGLLGVDHGVDRDQGLAPVSAQGALRPLTRALLAPAPAEARPAALGAGRLAGGRLPGLAGGAARLRVLEHRQLHRDDRPPADHRQLHRPAPGRGLPGHHPADRGPGRRRHRRSTWCWRSRWRSSWPRWPGGAGGRCCWPPCSPRCGPATWSRRTPGGSCSASGGLLDWALEPLGLHGPGFGLTAVCWCCPTCGCRT